MADIFFECTVFIDGFSQIRQPDIHHTDKNNWYYARIKNDFWSLVSYNVKPKIKTVHSKKIEEI